MYLYRIITNVAKFMARLEHNRDQRLAEYTEQKEQNRVNVYDKCEARVEDMIAGTWSCRRCGATESDPECGVYGALAFTTEHVNDRPAADEHAEAGWRLPTPREYERLKQSDVLRAQQPQGDATTHPQAVDASDPLERIAESMERIAWCLTVLAEGQTGCEAPWSPWDFNRPKEARH